MHATTSFLLHLKDGIPGYPAGSHRIPRGTEIPDEMVPFIRNQDVVSEALPHLVEEAAERGEAPPAVPQFVDFDPAKMNRDEVLDWALNVTDQEERKRRAEHALALETDDAAGKNRKGVIEPLEAFLENVD